MSPADRLRLQQILATFDEAGLVALANKGLVRRAQKDYEAGGLSWEETETAIIVRGPEGVVTMPATGPGDARDGSQATGVTRQILTATMFLRDQWCKQPAASPSPTAPPSADGDSSTVQAAPEQVSQPASESPPTVANPELEKAVEELQKLSTNELIKWAGKIVVDDATAVMQSGTQVEISRSIGLVVRFPQHETEVRLIPKPWGRSIAALLDQFLTNSPKAFRRQWVAAAIMALRAEAGLPALSQEVAERETVENLQSRSQVLATTAELLQGMTRTGLAHPSDRMVQRLFTLSVSATGAHLPRLSRSLRAIADEVELLLSRDAQGNSDRLFDQLCLVHALTTALGATDRPSLDLVGRHRTEYEVVGDLQLTGAGAFPWRTASGFEGVTAFFWDGERERFWTWTESRPEDGPGIFNVENVYQASAPWMGSPALSELCRRRFTLKNARANPQGRLSSSQQSTVESLQPANTEPVVFGAREFQSWQRLVEYLQRNQPLGLALPDPLQRIVVVRPTQWGTRVFDETQQRLVWTLLDDLGLPLQMIVRWEAANEATIGFLESVKVDRDRLTGVICRVELQGTGLTAEPLVLLSDGTPNGDRLLNPGFDQRRIEVKQATLLERLRAKFGRGQISSTIAVDDDQTSAPNRTAHPPTIEFRLSELESRLLRLAETGMHQLDDLNRQQLNDLGNQLQRIGLSQLAEALRQLTASASPADLLWCRYVCRLHREAK